MLEINKKKHILIGFIISVLSIIIGSITLFSIDQRRKNFSTKIIEIKSLQDSQVVLKRRASSKYDSAEINFGVSHLLPEKSQSSYLYGVEKMLIEADILNFGASYNLSEDFVNSVITYLNATREHETAEYNDILEEDEIVGDKLIIIEELLELINLTSKIPNYDKIANISQITAAREVIKNNLSNKYYESVLIKNKEIYKHKFNIRSLDFWFNFTTYLSICLQVIGLIFILLKDLGSANNT